MDLFPIQIDINLAAGTDDDRYYNLPSGVWRLESVIMTPNTTVATNGSDYRTTTFKKGSTGIASQTTNSTGGAARTAGTTQSVTVSGTGSNLEFTGGTDPLVFSSVKTGGTGAVEDASYLLMFRKIRSAA